MPPINSLPEAHKALAGVISTMESVKDFVAKFEAFLGGAMAGTAPEKKETLHGSNGTQEQKAIAKLPMSDRVVAIFNDATKPLLPKEAVAEYERRGWPKPPNGKLYATVVGSILYLTNRKKVLERREDGYALKA